MERERGRETLDELQKFDESLADSNVETKLFVEFIKIRVNC